MSAPVVVAGTGRCGTSVVARICEELGVDMGGPGNTERESNPGGDYEREDIRLAGEEYKAGDISAAEYRALLDYVAAEADGPWGFKHPLTSEFFQQIISAFPKAHIIWCQRDLEQTAESWNRWYDRTDDAIVVVRRRHQRLSNLLAKRRGVLTIDMTNHWDEDELSDLVESYLQRRGAI